MQWSFLLIVLLVFIISVGESSSSVQEVNGIVGESFTFFNEVSDTGSLIYNNINIGMVVNSNSATDLSEKFKNRLRWNKQSGLFTLSHLRSDDSGLYTLQNKNIQYNYQLNIYDKAPGPRVYNTFSSSENDCVILCSVGNMRNLTLSWYNDKILLNQTSSSSLNKTLDLFLNVKKTNNHTFICEASNPASTQETRTNIAEICPNGKVTKGPYLYYVMSIICAVLLVAMVVLMVQYMKKQKTDKSSQRTEELTATEGQNIDVQYSEIYYKKHSQSNLHEPTSEEAQPLTTIYDRIRLRE